MSNSISIDEPFQLSTYTSSYGGKQKSPITEHVFVTSVVSRSGKSKSINGEGLVTVATQADGIHLVDVGGRGGFAVRPFIDPNFSSDLQFTFCCIPYPRTLNIVFVSGSYTDI